MSAAALQVGCRRFVWAWHQTLDRYGVEAVLLPVDFGLTGALKESSRWKVAYDDGIAILFQPVGETAPLVAAASEGSRAK